MRDNYRFNSRVPRYNDDSNYTTNAPSYYDDLARKSKLIKELSEKVWGYDQTLYDALKEIENTLNHYADILDGKIEDFDTIITERTEQWLDEHMTDIISRALRVVWFGLTDDGYFMAVSPESWKDIMFDTTVDGELILKY